MDCQAYQRWFSPYIDGALGAEERGQLEAHLATCSRCQTELVSLQRMLGTLKMMEQPQAPDLLPGVRRKLARQPWWRGVLDRATSSWSLPWHQLALAGTAAVAIVAVGIQHVTRDHLSDAVRRSTDGYAPALQKTMGGRQETPVSSMSKTVKQDKSGFLVDDFKEELKADGRLEQIRRNVSSGAGGAKEFQGVDESGAYDREDLGLFGGDPNEAGVPMPEEGTRKKPQAEQVSTPPMGVTIAIPEREVDAIAQAKAPVDSASCKAQDGVWGTFGLAQVQLCNMPTNDADKECTDASQCESHACIAEAGVAPGQPATGRCYRWTVTLGACLNRVIGGQATGTLCED